jgi:hypothetical protein
MASLPEMKRKARQSNLQSHHAHTTLHGKRGLTETEALEKTAPIFDSVPKTAKVFPAKLKELVDYENRKWQRRPRK